MNRWYMHNSESVLENEMGKIIWDFEVQTDYRISVRRPDIWMVNKQKKKEKKNTTFQIVYFPVFPEQRVKRRENKKRDKYLDLARKLKNFGTWKWRWNRL